MDRTVRQRWCPYTNRSASWALLLSESDKEILGWFARERHVEPLIPDNIPQKESLAFLVAALPQPECLLPSVKTATDVLRVAAAMSEGDVSLAEPTKFRNFSIRERRFLLACLENVGNSRIEDTHDDTGSVVEAFCGIAPKVSTPVLLFGE